MVRRRTKARQFVSLREDVVRGLAPLGAGQQRVDREKGVIYGVKVLGQVSVNRRRYSKAAIAKALKQKLYEGRGVYSNHPKSPNEPRDVEDRFGWLEAIRLGDDGALYGDLYVLLPQSELAQKVFVAADKKPDLFGLSHNAQGEGQEDSEGVFVIEQITEVRSVDVVTDPATTNGLFEQRQSPMKITIKQLFENSWKKYAGKVKHRPRLAAVMKRLVEDDDMGIMDDEAAGVDEVPGDHEAALKGGFDASCSAIIAQALSGEMDPKEALGKLKELLTAHAKLSGGEDKEEDDVEEEEEPEEKKKEEEKKTEEQRRIKELERKDKARDLCEEMGVACDKVLLEALTGLSDEKSMKRFLEREKGKAPGKGTAPRSGAGGGDKGGDKSKTTLEGTDTPEGVMAALLN